MAGLLRRVESEPGLGWIDAPGAAPQPANEARRRWLRALRDAGAGRWVPADQPPDPAAAIALVEGERRVATLQVSADGTVRLRVDGRLWRAQLSTSAVQELGRLRAGW